MTESREQSGLTRSVDEETEPAVKPGADEGYQGESGPDPEGVQPEVPIQDPEGDPTVVPEPGGYTPDRDPKSDMPKVPSVPETQEHKQSHDAAPNPDKIDQSGDYPNN
jgi:hypothetical protein